MGVMAARVTVMGTTSMGRAVNGRATPGAGHSDGPSPPPSRKALCAVVDHHLPRKHWEAANQVPPGPGSTAAPPVRGRGGRWRPTSPPQMRRAGAGRRPRLPLTPPHSSETVLCAVADRLKPANRCVRVGPGATLDPVRPLPPPSRGSEAVSGGPPPANICVRVGPGRPHDLDQPPSPPTL